MSGLVIWICARIGVGPEVERVFGIAMWACVYCRQFFLALLLCSCLQDAIIEHGSGSLVKETS